MEPNGFPGSMADDSAEVLSPLWFRKAHTAVGMTAPEGPIPDDGNWRAPWFTLNTQENN